MGQDVPPARVLVISESELRRRELRAALLSDGHEVVAAATCLDALRLAGVGPGGRADVVVLDVTGMAWSGLELLETLVEAGNAPVIAMSDREESHGLACGACAVLTWPLVASRLRAEVRRLTRPWLSRKE
jgi:DNA-binding response OmpR family regulator